MSLFREPHGGGAQSVPVKAGGSISLQMQLIPCGRSTAWHIQYYAKDLCKSRTELSRKLAELTVFDSNQKFLHRACSPVGNEESYWGKIPEQAPRRAQPRQRMIGPRTEDLLRASHDPRH